MATTDAERLAQLEAEFEALGGRGVDLAEEIDALRVKVRGAEVMPIAVAQETDQDGRLVVTVTIGRVTVAVHQSITYGDDDTARLRDYPVVQVDTEDDDVPVNVYLNDGDLWRGSVSNPQPLNEG